MSAITLNKTQERLLREMERYGGVSVTTGPGKRIGARAGSRDMDALRFLIQIGVARCVSFDISREVDRYGRIFKYHTLTARLIK